MKLNGYDWAVVASVFAGDIVLLTVGEEEPQRVVHEFCRICVRRKLRVKSGKSKVMVFERKEVEVVDFTTLYRAGVGNLRHACEP